MAEPEQIFLYSMSASGEIQQNPTLEAGDFLLSAGGGTPAPLDTLPTVEPTYGYAVLVQLSARERGLQGSKMLFWRDQTSPAEWAHGFKPLTGPTAGGAGDPTPMNNAQKWNRDTL